MRQVMADRERFEGVGVALEMHHWRAAGGADGLNLINGVEDVIQKRAHRDDQVYDVWVIDDDANVREFHCAEEPAEQDRYTVTVRKV